ncbi:MAG: amidase domain-containing protein [Emergencia sp.]
MRIKVLSFMLTLVLIISAFPFNAFAMTGKVEKDIQTYNLKEAKQILDDYLLDNNIVLDTDEAYYEYCLTQLLDSRDEKLSVHPDYPVIEEFMVQYKLAYEDYLLCCDLMNKKTPETVQSFYSITGDNDCIQYSDNKVAFSLSEEFLNRTIQDIIDEANSNDAQESVGTKATYSYSAAAAANYATTYAKVYNRAVYPVYGSDCTNFVSQCLKAGGIPTVGTNSTTGTYASTTKWYCKCTYDPGANAANARQYAVTTSWIRVSDFNTYMTSVAKDKSYKSTMAGLYNNCRVGDVVQLVSSTSGTAYHTVIISKRDSTTAYYCGHSSDKKNEPISTIFSNTNKVILFDFT